MLTRAGSTIPGRCQLSVFAFDAVPQWLAEPPGQRACILTQVPCITVTKHMDPPFVTQHQVELVSRIVAVTATPVRDQLQGVDIRETGGRIAGISSSALGWLPGDIEERRLQVKDDRQFVSVD